MRIGYVAQTDADRESGVNKKLVDQVSAWGRLGQDVRLFVLSRSPRRWRGWDRIDASVYEYAGPVQGLRASERLLREIEGWGPDTIYFRMGVCYPAFQRMAKTWPLIVEINTDDEHEGRVRMSWVKFLMYRYGVKKLVSRAAGAVCVNSVSAAKMKARGLEVLVLGNAIDIALHPPSPSPTHPDPRLVFLGSSGCVWHGVDKLRPVARRFPTWRIDVVGLRREEVGGEWPGNVVFHGFLPNELYRGLIEDADVAVGTLALERIGMTETSSLKVREYLAAGLPVIIGHRDPDFRSSVPFILELPVADSNVSHSLDRIESFVRSWKGHRVERSAVAHLDVGVKEARRIAFFESRLTATRGTWRRRLGTR